jgi:transcriptional regulator with XRE-family HTH domain
MMSNLPEVISNKTILDEHVAHIQDALNSAKLAIFDVASAIKVASDELGDEIVYGELADRLGMSKGTLSKWLRIASSDFILANRDAMPSTFTSLYNLTQLESQYQQAYASDAENKMLRLIEQGKITPTSEIEEIKSLLNQIKARQTDKSRKQREEAINSLAELASPKPATNHSISDLLTEGLRFRTFVFVLTKDIERRWGDEAYLESDICEEFPLHELRSVSVSEPVQMFVLGRADAVPVALKIVSAFGFAFRGLYFSAVETNGLALCKSNPIVVRGERGIAAQAKFAAEIKSTSLDDILDYAEITGGQNRVLIFSETDRADWTVVSQ